MVAQILSLLVLALAALQLQAMPATSPAPLVSVATPDLTEPPKDDCGVFDKLNFDTKYCNQYPHFLLPNPRQQDLDEDSKQHYFWNARTEFNHFTPLIESKCHEKLLTLLCFFYFPFCDKARGVTVFPCKELCLDVTAEDGECNREIKRLFLERTGKEESWSDLPQFDCENYEYKGSKLYKNAHPDPRKMVCANDSLPFPSSEPPPTTTTVAPTTTPTTAAPTQHPCALSEEPVCKKCTSRNNLNGGTFINRNNAHYNFAVKATFVSYTTHNCRSALEFTLEKKYDLKSSDTCEVVSTIPDTFLVLGEHWQCETDAGREENGCFKSLETSKSGGDHLEVGQTYLISGTHSTTDDGSQIFEATNRPLIAKWSNKIKKNIESNVASGNSHRCPSS